MVLVSRDQFLLVAAVLELLFIVILLKLLLAGRGLRQMALVVELIVVCVKVEFFLKGWLVTF